MFEVHDDDGLIRIRVSGALDETAMREGLDAFLALAESRDRVRLLYEVTDVGLPTMSALMVEFGYVGRLFSVLPKCDRVGLVANQAWVEQAATLESLLIPGLEIRNYDSPEAAMRWLRQDL